MRKLFLLIAAGAVVVALTGASSADAKCGVKCLNKKVNQLSGQVSRAQATIDQQAQQIAQTTQDLNQLHSCFAEAPLTDFGDAAGSFGYVFDNDGNGGDGPFFTSALDISETGGPVTAWFLFDSCNTATTASATAAKSSIAPSGALGAFGSPQARTP
jgi:outer membrane murein-binding lipoprotein Lpp